MTGCHGVAERLLRLAAAVAALLSLFSLCQPLQAQDTIDIASYFQKAYDAGRAGLARKTKPVDVRPAKQGEVIITIIAGEGNETQSPPAGAGDMVVRNLCPETGNEQILVAAATFADRYEGPIAAADTVPDKSSERR